MPKTKKKTQPDQEVKRGEMEQLLDEQTNVILTATRDIVNESHRKLDKRISSLERQVTRLVGTLEHYITKAEALDEEFTFLKVRLRRVEEKLGLAKEY